MRFLDSRVSYIIGANDNARDVPWYGEFESGYAGIQLDISSFEFKKETDESARAQASLHYQDLLDEVEELTRRGADIGGVADHYSSTGPQPRRLDVVGVEESREGIASRMWSEIAGAIGLIAFRVQYFGQVTLTRLRLTLG
jgi:hypothetical protein